MPGLIDLHSHVLPGLDDGPDETDESVALVTGLERLGFVELHPTPHQRADRWFPDEAARGVAADDLTRALSEAGCGVRIGPPGGENMWDGLFLERQDDGSFPGYEGNKAFLLEFMPDTPPPHLEDRLFDFQIRHRRLPVIAHIERFGWLPKRPESLAQRAALLVNLGALGGQSGWWLKRRARRLVLDGIAHAAATDAHGLACLPYIEAGLGWIRGELGEGGLHGLLVDGPRRILAGEIP